jgi:hypothetical protein
MELKGRRDKRRRGDLEKKRKKIDWPPASADLNPIE